MRRRASVPIWPGVPVFLLGVPGVLNHTRYFTSYVPAVGCRQPVVEINGALCYYITGIQQNMALVMNMQHALVQIIPRQYQVCTGVCNTAAVKKKSEGSMRFFFQRRENIICIFGNHEPT